MASLNQIELHVFSGDGQNSHFYCGAHQPTEGLLSKEAMEVKGEGGGCARTVNATKAKLQANYIRSKLSTKVRQQMLVTHNEGFFEGMTLCITGLHCTHKL